MKLLIIKSKKTTPHPHLWKDAYIEKIKEIDMDIKIVVTSDEEEILSHIVDSDIVAGSPRDIPPTANAKNLKWIHSFSAGVERILTPQVVNSSIIMSNSSGIHATPIAEHVIGFILIFTRKFYETFYSQQKNAWERREDLSELRDKVVLVAGLGHIGSEVARLANCFGAHVVAIDNGGNAKPDFVEDLKRGEYLEDALSRADFVVSCLPYTKETHHLFGIDKFKKMKPTAVFINIGRGGVVNEADLIQALRDKTISGAGLDVTETEPLPSESPLWSMENVVITPHHSGLSDKYMDRAIDRFCLNLKAYLAGEKLPNLIDKEKGY